MLNIALVHEAYAGAGAQERAMDRGAGRATHLDPIAQVHAYNTDTSRISCRSRTLL